MPRRPWGRAVLLASALLLAAAVPAGADPLSTVAGTGTAAFSGDGGPAANAALNFPVAVVAHPAGGYLIADQVNHRVRRVAADGTIITVAGNGTAGFSGDGGPATAAQLNAPSGLAVAADTSILIADANNDRVRRVAPGGTITTVAGGGGALGDGGPATSAQLLFPYAIAVQPDGGYLIASTDQHRIRRVSPGGVITTVAGTGAAAFSGDGGTATAAALNKPQDVTATADGGFLIADTFNERVRKVSAGGTITTVAGDGVGGFAGDGGPATAARLSRPIHLAATADGFLVADQLNHRVRRVAGATITTVAGDGTAAFLDAADARSGRLDRPAGVAVDAAGDILIADAFNHRIRRIDVPGLAPPAPAPGPPPPPPPSAAFTAPARAAALTPVTLDAGNTTGAVRLQWDFDSNGTVDLTSAPRDSSVRLMVPAGKRLDVSLIVTGASGATDTARNTILLGGSRLPSAVTARLPTVMTSGPPAIATATAILAGRPCIDGTTVAFRLVAARGCFTRTGDLADVPRAERALGARHYENGQYEVPSVVASLCAQAARGELPQARCDEARRLFRRETEIHISTRPIRLNGITIRPRNGTSVVLFASAERLLASDAVMTWGGMTVKQGEIDLNLASQVKVMQSAQARRDFPTGRAALLTFTGRDLANVAGFQIDGAVSLAIGSDAGVRYSEGSLNLRLPRAFSLFGGNPPSGATTLRADNDREPDLDSLRISVPEAYLGSVRFTDLSFEYRARGGIDGDVNPGTSCDRNEWKARGNVFLTGGKGRESGLRMTPPPAQNGVGFCAGAFKHAGGEFSFPDPRPVIFPGITLDKVNFGLQLNPFLVRGGATISVRDTAVVEGAMLLTFPTEREPYVLTARDAGAPFKILAGRRFTSATVAVGGDVRVNVPAFGQLGFGSAALMYSAPGYVFFGGNVRLVAPGLAVTGGVSGELSLETGLFQLGGGGEVCIGINLVCLGANANVGSRGFSACARAGGLSPGAGYRFTDGYIGIWPIDGCKPSRFWITDVRNPNALRSRAAQAQPLSFEVAEGEGVKQVRLTGAQASPSVTVRGPSGATLTVDDARQLAYSAKRTIGGIQEREGKRTFISLDDGPGRYTVTPDPGSAPITEVAESRKGFDSEYEARVRGRGERRTLEYDLGGKGTGQEVTFYEEGRDVFQRIGKAAGGKGTLSFTPAEGEAVRRVITAVATLNGVPIPEQRLATFTVAPEPPVGRPSDVEVQRRGKGLEVDWDEAERAKGYGVVVRQADGRVRRYETGAGTTELLIAEVARQFGGTVTVTARDDERDWSQAAQKATYPRRSEPFTVVQTDRDNAQRDAKAQDERLRGRRSAGGR
jgi:hypothetical protein